MKKFIRSFLYLSLSLTILAGCGEEPKTTPAASETVDSSPLVIPTGSPLYMKIGLQWESTTGNTFEDFATCAVLPGLFETECVIKVPEARLHYSNVRFTAGTQNPADCSILTFNPYYYMRSEKKDYLPPDAATGTETIDCSVLKPPAKCYGGAAPSLVKTFSSSDGMYFLTKVTTETNYDLKSENSLRWYGDYGNVNYLVTNDLSAANRLIPDTSGGFRERTGKLNSYHDYRLSCIDLWAKPTHRLKLTIADENVDSTGGADEFPDWNN